MNRGFKKYFFIDIVSEDKGFLRGPFGGNLKKEIFVPKGENTYKVYEQGVVLRKDHKIGRYNITGEYFNEKMYRFSVEPKDFLVSCSGANYGAIFQMPDNIERGVINQALLRIRLNNKLIDDNYFDYFFSHHLVNQIIGKKGDSTIPNFPPVSVLKKLEVQIHSSTDYQKQIAKVLSDLDAKIEINNQINQQLEAMAKTLYDYWFVQFDFPSPSSSSGQAGKPYKSSCGKMVFNEELKLEIPEGWEVDNLLSWIKNDKSGDWGKAEKQGNYVNKVSCVRGADLNGLNGKGAIKSPTRFILEKNNHKLLEIGDFIIEISGGSPTQSTGRMAFITKETLERFENPLICSNFCKAVTLKEEKALYNFAYEWNRLYDAGVLFGWEGKTSGIKNLLFESFVTNHQIVIPDFKVMEQFYNKAKPIHSKIQTNLKQNQKLSELRDWLLPMLMNGQVTVQEAEDNLENIFGKAFNFDFEIACIIYLTEEVMGNRYGRKYLHKTLSNIQMLASVPKVDKIVFKEYFWGMYSDLVNDTIKNAKRIETAVTPNGKTVFKVKSSSKNELKSWMNEPENIPFVSEVNLMLAMYQQEPIKKRMNSIELLNTVLECINVLDTYDFEKVYGKMQKWEMQEGDYRFKSDKFSKVKVKEMVGFVRSVR